MFLGTGTFDWKAACMEREYEYRKWMDQDRYLNKLSIQFGFCVDVVHITKVN